MAAGNFDTGLNPQDGDWAEALSGVLKDPGLLGVHFQPIIDLRRGTVWGYEALARSDAAFAFSVTSYAFPIQRAVRITPDGRVDAIYPEHRMTRSQDLEHAYHDAGQFYWGTARAFLEDMPLFAPHSIGVILPRHLVQDIDTLEDWDQAELMYRASTARKQ